MTASDRDPDGISQPADKINPEDHQRDETNPLADYENGDPGE